MHLWRVLSRMINNLIKGLYGIKVRVQRKVHTLQDLVVMAMEVEEEDVILDIIDGNVRKMMVFMKDKERQSRIQELRANLLREGRVYYGKPTFAVREHATAIITVLYMTGINEKDIFSESDYLLQAVQEQGYEDLAVYLREHELSKLSLKQFSNLLGERYSYEQFQELLGNNM